MAKAKLKTTDTLGKMDAKQLAEMLRRMGRGRDTVLAHITPREARKLKSEGGRGSINPNTGLPEFEEIYDVASYGDFSSPQFQEVLDTYSGDYGASPEAYDMSGYYYEPDFGASQQADYAAPQEAYYDPYSLGPGLEQALFQQPVTGAGDFTYAGAGVPQTAGADLSGLAAQYGGFTSPEFQQVLSAYGGPAGRTAELYDMSRASELTDEERRLAEEGMKQTEEDRTAARAGGKGFLDQLLGKLDLATLAKLGLAGGAAMMGRRQQGQAVQQAQRAAEQMKTAYTQAGQELRQLAQPTLGPAITGLAQAQQGALDPARLRQLEIERARLAQTAAKTGGVGAIQSAEAMNRARQDALTAQQAAALQLLGPSNTLLAQAIQANLRGTTQGLGLNLQLQQQANQAAANLYGQLGRFSGMA